MLSLKNQGANCIQGHPNNQQMNYVCLYISDEVCVYTFAPGAGCTHHRHTRLHEEEITLLPRSLHYVWGFWGPALLSFDFDSLINENTSGPS